MRDHSNSQVCILVLDDDPEAAENLQGALEEFPEAIFHVTAFHDGREAIRAVADHPDHFDVALVDMDLNDPSLDGIGVMRELFKHNRWLPVILFTGQDSAASAVEAIGEGAYFYLDIRKGSIRPRETAAHCLQAVKNRALLRTSEVRQVSLALSRTRDLEEVLNAYVGELGRLGYKSGAIYLYGPGWLVGEEVMPGVRSAIEHKFLYQVRTFADVQLPLFYDLSEPSQMTGVLDEDRKVVPFQDPELGDVTYQVIPLRDQVTHDRKLGAVLLGPRPDESLGKEEEAALALLGEQISLAVRNAIDFHLQHYRTRVWDLILEMNRNISALLETPETQDSLYKIMDEVASAISRALGFGRVLISVVAHGKAELCGIFGLPQEEADKRRGQKTPLSELQKLDQEIYRHDSTFFIPAGCFDMEQYNGGKIESKAASGDAFPWRWHAQDQIRTRVKNAQEEVVAYIAMDDQNDTRPEEGTFHALEIFAIRLADLLENIAVRRHRTEMEVIKRVGDTLNSIREREDLFPMVHEQLSQLMYAARIKFGTYNPEKNEIIIDYEHGETTKLKSIPMGRGLMSCIIEAATSNQCISEDSNSLLLPTLDDVRRFHAERKMDILGDEACSWMGTPLQVEGKVLGVMALEHDKEEYAYDKHDRSVLEIVGTSVANALQRIALEDARDKGILEALEAVSAQLVGAVVSTEQVEQRILESAAQLTNADYGVFLHYDQEKDQLIVRPEDWYVRDPNSPRPPLEEVYLPIKQSRNRQPTSLAVHAARDGEVRKWDDVTKEKDYRHVLPGIHSLIAMPVFVADPKTGVAGLYGVWTMEALRKKAFTKAHVDVLKVFSYFAVNAVERAQKQQEVQSLLAWSLLNVNSTVVQHLLPNLITGVQNSLSSVGRHIQDADREVRQLGDMARSRANAAMYRIENIERVAVNYLVRDALATFWPLANTQTIRIPEPKLYLPDKVTVTGNRWGLQEVLLTILANAYNKLLESPRSRFIQVSTDRARDGGSVIRIFNSGAPLSADVAAYLNAPNGWEPRFSGLSQARFLLGIYGATLRVRQNNEDGVELELYWPPNVRKSRKSATPTPEHRKHLTYIRQQIAQRRAQQFLPEVVEHCDEWELRYKRLSNYLQNMQGDFALLESYLSPDLDRCSIVAVHDLLQRFLEDMKRWQIHHKVAISYNRLGTKSGARTEVWANTTALALVLHNLVSNAIRAIRTAAERGDAAKLQPPAITIEAERLPDAFVIRFRNTGSVVDPDVWELLTRQPVPDNVSGKPSGHGMGLFLGNVLINKCGGSLSPTENDPQTGVVFTIRLRYATDVATRSNS
ncbi:MAG: GAF domain-containing protein [Chloroflexota bacterium]|nr:GAF domain-containing protein [Chloroflexota bacterium]